MIGAAELRFDEADVVHRQHRPRRHRGRAPALASALAAGAIAAAGLDVFDDEPPAKDHPLLGFDQVVLSPHIAGLTQRGGGAVAVASSRTSSDFFAGRLNPPHREQDF